MNYYEKSIDDIYKEFNSSYEGLNSLSMDKLTLKYGKNILKERKKKSKIIKFLEQFKNSMIIILLIVAIIMLIYGLLYTHDYTDSIIIFVVVFINTIMGYIQIQKAEVTLESLKKYNKIITKVRRDNNIIAIDSQDLVPGDIIILDAGDKIPADARIISESGLKVDESPLTGETLAVRKSSDILSGNKIIQDQTNMLFSGCNIVNGHAEAIVVKTSMNTELGKVATSLDTPYEVITPLELKIQEISKKLTMLIFLIIIFMFIFGVIKGYKMMEIIMLCVSLAVAAIPEGLPAVITISLSIGASALAKKKTVVRQMSAVETLGTTDVICSDKTGTITQNKMQVVDTIIYDEIMFKYIASLANDSIITDEDIIGDPTETSLIDYLKLKDEDVLNIIKENPRIYEIPFDSERKLMSTINEINGEKYILTKGSLDNLLKKCKYIIVDGKKEILSKEKQNEIYLNEYNMASKALRVLGFAYKKINRKIDEKNLLKEENNLIFVGITGAIDPPRDKVKISVSKCKKAGILPIMITGDSLITACAIAKNIGILESDEDAILGEELDNITDSELQKLVFKYKVYARVSPVHKQRIVSAWQKNGKVVAMTGDGVNDAPAIKDAHVGVGLGITGTEVTKSVADVILLDDSFSTIVDAVEEGRRIFTNIRNNIVYSLSSNFAELFIVLIGMFTGHNILLPIHILFIDLVTDTIPSICLAFEKSENKIMEKEPRGIDKPMFTPFIKASILYSSFIETIFSIIIYFLTYRAYGETIAASMTLLSVVIQEIIYSMSCRNLKEYFYKQGLLSNKLMNIGLIGVIIMELIVFLTPIGSIIHVEMAKIGLIIVVVFFNLFGLVLYEIGKPILKLYFKD